MTHPNQDNSGKWFMFAILAIFVLGGLGVAAAVSLGGGDDIDGLLSTAPVEVSGEPLLPMSAGGVTTAETDPAAGMVAPDLVGTDFFGEEVSITADGTPKIIYFVAHWCPHCQREVPSVVELVEQGLVPEGVDIYTVSTAVDATRGNHPPSVWLDEEGWEFPVIRDNGDSAAYAAYGAAGFPYTVYLDGENKVLFRSSGSLDQATTLQLWGLTAASAS